LLKAIAAKDPQLAESEIKRAVTVIFDAMIDQLASGGRVELRGFGSFSVRSYGARKSTNPRSGAAVTAPPRRLLYFRPAKKWKTVPRP
jgi:integration host factor subunit beta